MAGVLLVAHRRTQTVIGVVLLLALLATELALSARQQSQTFDEACHLFAGYRYWKDFDFGINPEHPPLVKLAAALPILRLPLQTSPVPNDYFKFVGILGGREFLYANDADTLLFRARLSAAGFTLCLALAVFLVTCSMFGVGPAFLALAILIFEPNILAHGALVTTDMGVTCGLFLAVSSFYFYLKKPSAWRLAGAGLATGVCLSSKHSGILVFPILLFLLLGEILSEWVAASREISPEFGKKLAGQIASLTIVCVIALLTLWSFYGFRYSSRPSGLSMIPPLPVFASGVNSPAAAGLMLIARWHLLPEAYLYGWMDILAKEAVPTSVFGKYYSEGQWFYFPAIFTMKSTLAFLFLCCLVPVCRVLREKQFRREALCLVIPPMIYLAAAMASKINYGVRHILPIYPFLIVLISFCAWKLARQRRAYAVLVAFLVLFHVASSIRGFPNYLAYVNELWGGPEHAYRNLADSNVDWGQGLKAMRRYLDQQHIRDCWFAYYGSVAANSAYYKIPCKPLPASVAHLVQMPMPVFPQFIDGPVFISASELSGTQWGSAEANPYLPFRKIAPAAVIAGSILVFDGRFDVSPAAAVAHESVAAEFMRTQHLAEALAEANIAIALAPHTSMAHAARGTVLAMMKKDTEAQEEFQKAQELVSATTSEP